MKVHLKNSTGVTKELKVGFSWTILFFGWITILFRGDIGEFIKWIILFPLTLGIWGIVQCFTANKKYIIKHLEKGYEPATDYDKNLLIEKGIIS